MSSLPSPTVIEQELMSDPYPMLARLRTAVAAYHNPNGNRWYITRHADVDALLRGPQYGKDPRKAAQGTLLARTMGAMPRESLSMLWLDPPEHTRLRQLVTRAFTRSAVEEWRLRIQEITDSLLDNVGTMHRFDLVEMLAAPLPGRVITEILGVNSADLPTFRKWSDELIGSDPLSRRLAAASDSVTKSQPFLTSEERVRMHEAEVNVTTYFLQQIEERRVVPRDDLISRLVTAQSSNHQVSDTELALDFCKMGQRRDLPAVVG